MGGAVKEAAKQAARDEWDAHGWQVSDYVVGRLIEAAVAVVQGVPIPAEMPALDLPSWESA